MNQQRNNYKSGTKKCVNPVFEEWLVELRDDAIARDLQSKHTYTKCLQSLRKYPLPLKTGKECVILEGFGDKICKLIDEKLTSFIQDGGVLHQQEDEITYERTVSVSYRATTSKSSSNIVQNRYNANDDDDEDRLEILDDTTSKPQSSNILKEASNKPLLKKSKTIPQRSAEGEIESVAAETSTKNKKRANPKEYKPGVRSGGYAILVALYNHENENDGDESSASYMLKADLIREAQKHCDSSFTFSLDPNNRYTAWSSMSTLVKKEYVVKENKLPARYHLTESGRRLAAKLLNGEDETETITQNQTDSDSEQVIDSPPKTLKYDWRTTNEKSNPVESCSSNSRLLQAEKSNKIIDEDIVQLSESDSEVVTLSDDLQVDEVYTQKASTKLSPLKKPQQKKEIIVGNDTDEELPDIGTFTSQMSARSSKTDVFVDDDFSDPKFIAQQMEIEKQIKRTPTNLMKSKSSSMMSSSSGNSSKPMTQTMDTIPDKRVVEKPPIISSKQQSASSAMSSKTAALSADYSNGAPSTMFKMNPGTFEIILYVDNCEQSHAKRQDMLMDELKKSNIRFESGKLHIGDFVWIARSKNANGLGTDLVLNYAVERKRMDDFCSSIIDGRYKEQKFRLNKCGITNPIYLIEEFGSTKHMSLPEKSLIQADVNTQLIDHFVVHHTTDVKDSAAYLIALTKYIDRVHRNLTLHGCLKTDLDGYLKRVGPSLSKTKTPLVYLMTFEEFNEFSNKNKPLSIREMFAKWLMKIQGVSQEKCIPIIELYPTPTLLISAYSKCENESKREKLLATVKFGSQQRNIGPVISKLISQLFYSNKPLS